MAMMLYSIPRSFENVDAIAVLPGLGESWRLIDAVNSWESAPTAKHFLVAGTYGEERTQVQPTVEYLSQPPINLRRLTGVQTQVDARHTKAQADWLVGKVAELNITSLALFVSPYHLLRGYCTTLRSFNQLGVNRVPMIPIPSAVSPITIIPEVGVDGWSMVQGEVERIIAYQQKGDVASCGELKEYLGWLWEQPILNNQSSLSLLRGISNNTGILSNHRRDSK